MQKFLHHEKKFLQLMNFCHLCQNSFFVQHLIPKLFGKFKRLASKIFCMVSEKEIRQKIDSSHICDYLRSSKECDPHNLTLRLSQIWLLSNYCLISFWPLLNWSACHSPFLPNLWMPLATVFVEIFLKEKNWRGFRPYLVTLWKEFEISFKKRRFQNFRTSQLSRSI